MKVFAVSFTVFSVLQVFITLANTDYREIVVGFQSPNRSLLSVVWRAR